MAIIGCNTSAAPDGMLAVRDDGARGQGGSILIGQHLPRSSTVNPMMV